MLNQQQPYHLENNKNKKEIFYLIKTKKKMNYLPAGRFAS